MALTQAGQAAPLQYLSGAGEKAAPVVALTWGVLTISLAVIILIGMLLVGAIWHRPGFTWAKGIEAEVKSQKGGLQWLWIGVGLSTLVLLFTVVWTIRVLAGISRPPGAPPVTIEVTGRQWWWEVRYLGNKPSRQFVTANEIHIPVGQPVRLRLIGGDVIHSFWVPQLAGKMDAIPGQSNETWIEADRPGTYRGQCTEYCGLQHAHMAMLVIAETQAQFTQWWQHQLAEPAQVQGTAFAGQQEFQVHCAGCHAIRGTEAAGALGPDLSHLRERQTLAAGSIPNTGPSLAHWISDPQSIKPGTLMPTPAASGRELADITAYLNTLE